MELDLKVCKLYLNKLTQSGTSIVVRQQTFFLLEAENIPPLNMLAYKGFTSVGYYIRQRKSLFHPSVTVPCAYFSEVIPPLQRFKKPFITPSYGIEILQDPWWNKGTAFDEYERDRLGLRGLLPPAIHDIETQKEKVLKHLAAEPTNEAKNMYLQDLHNRNETLYFRTLLDHIEEMAPLVYTPTVGIVCQKFGTQFRRARGMFFSKRDRGHMSSMVRNWPHKDVHVIVVTDGSRILGLGDLGVNGMGIPIGKLALYCAAGGIAPHRVLPVTLDVGTNNEELLKCPEYLGLREPRLTGKEYYTLVDEFMDAVCTRWPQAIVQFEDFESSKAIPLLERYRHTYRMFNDDIQGTGSVTLSGLMSALKATGGDLKNTRVLCVGAGSAGLGVCEQIVKSMVVSGDSRETAMSKFVVCTDRGTLGAADGKFGDPHYKGSLESYQKNWINCNVSDGMTISQAIKEFKPTVLLGLSTAGGIFNEEVVRAMGAINARPIIMPMSNPTSNCECTPENAYKWTDGQAVVATGSPFAPVTLADGRTFIPSQCNNMYIFPGIGLAASVSGVTEITDTMLIKAAEACTNSMTSEELAEGRTFPKIKRIREVSKNVALAVIEEGIKNHLTTKITKTSLQEGLPNFVERKMYKPTYYPLTSAARTIH